MGQVDICRMRSDFQNPANVQKKPENKEVRDDFKKLLKDKPSESKEPEKEYTPKEEAAQSRNPQDKPEVNENLAAMQMAQMLRENGMLTVPEEMAGAEQNAAVELIPADEEHGILMPEHTAEEGMLTEPEHVLHAGEENAAQKTGQTGAEKMTQEGVSEVQPEKTLKKDKAQVSDSSEKTQDVSANENAALQQAGQTNANAGAQRSSHLNRKEQVQPEKMHVERPEEIPQKLSEELLAKTAVGVKEFEIQIEPEHLGKIAIKVLYEQGQTTISIACSEKKTQELIGLNAREIGNVMERNLGEETTVFVEEQKPDYMNQNDNDHAGRESEQERQKEEQRKQQTGDSAQFLQKLRLGLNL